MKNKKHLFNISIAPCILHLKEEVFRRIFDKKIVLPKSGNKFCNRTSYHPGMIIKGDRIYQIFAEKGYEWGGDWTSLKDYQHFQKDPEHFVCKN